jgi:hypothetical protein
MSSTSPTTNVTPDLEKGFPASDVSPDSPASTIQHNDSSPTEKQLSGFAAWNQKIESLAGFEARGIDRVPSDERHEATIGSLIQMSLIWFSANLTINNLALGLLGPLVYELSFVDSALCAVFGGFVGCLGTSYMATWGAVSGNRTLVCVKPGSLMKTP